MISDCILIGFIRATETLKKKFETSNSRLQLTQHKYSKDSKQKINDRSGSLEKRWNRESDDVMKRTPRCGWAGSSECHENRGKSLEKRCEDLFVTFVTEVSLYSREAEPQIWENSLNSEISQKIAQFFSLLHSRTRASPAWSSYISTPAASGTTSGMLLTKPSNSLWTTLSKFSVGWNIRIWTRSLQSLQVWELPSTCTQWIWVSSTVSHLRLPSSPTWSRVSMRRMLRSPSVLFGSKEPKTQDTEVDFDVERKTFRDEIKSLERERARLELGWPVPDQPVGSSNPATSIGTHVFAGDCLRPLPRVMKKFRDFSENRSVLVPSALATFASRVWG